MLNWIIAMEKYKRISIDPQKMGGVPCIRNLRMPIATLIAMLADGYSIKDILNEHPELEKDDIFEALRYASEVMRVREIPLAM
ncbi:MAG: DUF433 domain-containing protein [Candidatus Hydrogenedentota bacterium]